MKKNKLHIISADATIKEGLKALNDISMAPGAIPLTLFIVDENEQLTGTLTDGDIRRGLLNENALDDGVCAIMHTDFHFFKEGEYSLEKIRQFREDEIDLVPVLGEDSVIKNILYFAQKESLLPVDAILMAGGEGRRLRPLTETTPKPLLKVGDKPIIEYIIDRLDKFGIPNLTLTINYLADQIIGHFEGCSDKWNLNINFLNENKPLGTIGALSLMNDFENDAILLSNADLLSTINYESFYEFFKETDADIAVASAPYNVKVPYGIFKTDGSDILDVEEKPEYSYFSNAGIYLLKRKLISQIPDNKYLDVTDFLKKMIDGNARVTYYPLLGYWQDIGSHDDFKKVQMDINLIDI